MAWSDFEAATGFPDSGPPQIFPLPSAVDECYVLADGAFFGWNDKEFLLGRDSLVRHKVLRRFDLNAVGWQQAFAVVTSEYPALGRLLAKKVRRHQTRAGYAAELAGREKLAEVSQCHLVGGANLPEASFPVGTECMLLFTDEGLWAHAPAELRPLMKLSYEEMQGLEITGAERQRLVGTSMAMMAGGAMMTAAIWERLTAASSVRTLIHLEARECDLFFLCTSAYPNALRVELAEVLRRLRTESPSSSPGIADQLERLAKLHTSGALTDEEFTLAKRRLITGAD